MLLVNANTHRYSQWYTQTHTRAHTGTHTHIMENIHTHTSTHTQIHTYAQRFTYTHSDKHTHTHSRFLPVSVSQIHLRGSQDFSQHRVITEDTSPWCSALRKNPTPYDWETNFLLHLFSIKQISLI